MNCENSNSNGLIKWQELHSFSPLFPSAPMQVTTWQKNCLIYFSFSLILQSRKKEFARVSLFCGFLKFKKGIEDKQGMETHKSISILIKQLSEVKKLKNFSSVHPLHTYIILHHRMMFWVLLNQTHTYFLIDDAGALMSLNCVCGNWSRES